MVYETIALPLSYVGVVRLRRRAGLPILARTTGGTAINSELQGDDRSHGRKIRVGGLEANADDLAV